MPRNREFDEAMVIETATDLFWKKGYHAVSTQDLIDAFGISKSSMYGAYKDKKNLFLLALENYRNNTSKKMIEVLQQERPFKKTMASLLNGLIKESLADAEHKGCFMVNTAVELAPHDKDISNIIEENRLNIVLALAQAIKRAIKNRELSTKHDPDALANYFYNFISGLRVDAKLSIQKPDYKNIAKIALSVLDE
jgi:TetR/AcrR family transcriptional regulator, transcriptional repressor for nem operon